MAGLLDVRADRAITWPEKQEIGELRLNFVRLSKKAGRVKVAFISTTPLVVGIFTIWYIANNIFKLPEILSQLNSGLIADLGGAIGRLTATPDVWLWVYLAFTVSNTMIPRDFKDFGGWWVILSAAGSLMVLLLVLGIGDDIFVNSIAGPLSTAFNILSSTFLIVMALDLFVTAILSIIENTIEYITGDSATFKDGKLIAMRRSEVQALRAQEMQKMRQKAVTRGRAAIPSGPPSIYKFPLPVPGAPGKEPVTQAASAIVSPAKPSLTTGTASPPERTGPNVVTGTASEKPAASPTSSPFSLRPSTPPTSTTGSPLAIRPPQPVDEDEEFDEDEVEET
jgi:hypothetical protein